MTVNVTEPELAVARHERALQLAKEIRHRPRAEWAGEIAKWRRTADEIRTIALAVRRGIRERKRARRARSCQAPVDEDLAFAMLVFDAVLRTSGREPGDEITPEDKRIALLAGVETAEAMRDFLDCGVDENEIGCVLPWMLTISAYVHRRGIELPGSMTAGILGVGKTNAVVHVAALALVELGFSNVEIASVLEIKDVAQVRRLTRAARVS